MMKINLRRLAFVQPYFLTSLLVPSLAGAAMVPVAEELERLADEHGFTVIGLASTEDAVGRADRDALYPRLRRLLEKFDHVIVQGPDGGIERVIIMGEKVPFAPPPPMGRESAQEQETGEGATAAETDIVVQTVRNGTQHSVRASLEGAGRKRVARDLLIDTGADFVVLPATMVKDLGIAPNDLSQREMQTANGKVTARIGRIPALWLGDHRIAGVDVAFIEDGKLGGGGLLGMSVLGRFTMTIDDEGNKLTLGKKD
jgi:clan AA aspartic protease (TIGR02281 family)